MNPNRSYTGTDCKLDFTVKGTEWPAWILRSRRNSQSLRPRPLCWCEVSTNRCMSVPSFFIPPAAASDPTIASFATTYSISPRAISALIAGSLMDSSEVSASLNAVLQTARALRRTPDAVSVRDVTEFG